MVALLDIIHALHVKQTMMHNKAFKPFAIAHLDASPHGGSRHLMQRWTTQQ